MPFGIVECTFSDNLSRNSCIQQRPIIGGVNKLTSSRGHKHANYANDIDANHCTC